MFTSEDYKAKRLGHYGQLGSYCVAEMEIGFARNCYHASQPNVNSVTTWFTEGPVPPSEIRLPMTSGWIQMPLGEVTCQAPQLPVPRTGLICVIDIKGTDNFLAPLRKGNIEMPVAFWPQEHRPES